MELKGFCRFIFFFVIFYKGLYKLKIKYLYFYKYLAIIYRQNVSKQRRIK